MITTLTELSPVFFFFFFFFIDDSLIYIYMYIKITIAKRRNSRISKKVRRKVKTNNDTSSKYTVEPR